MILVKTIWGGSFDPRKDSTTLLTMTCWLKKIRSIQEDDAWKICVKSFVVWCNLFKEVFVLTRVASFMSTSAKMIKKYTLDKKWILPLRISSINMTKSAGNYGFSHIYWKNPESKTSFFVQWCLVDQIAKLRLTKYWKL